MLWNYYFLYVSGKNMFCVYVFFQIQNETKLSSIHLSCGCIKWLWEGNWRRGRKDYFMHMTTCFWLHAMSCSLHDCKNWQGFICKTSTRFSEIKVLLSSFQLFLLDIFPSHIQSIEVLIESNLISSHQYSLIPILLPFNKQRNTVNQLHFFAGVLWGYHDAKIQ